MAMLLGDKVEKLVPSVLTPLELKILRMWRTKDAKQIAHELKIESDAVYSVFRRIRERREKWQMGVNFFNNLCKDRRYYMVLSPRQAPAEETVEEEEE